MKLWARVFLGYFLIVGFAGWFLLRVFVAEVKPGVRDAVEDVMVDTANLLAELAREELLNGAIANARFAKNMENYRARTISAPIWNITKESLDFRVYVTDDKGVVRYDSEDKSVGEDFSNWRDVARTLRGDYGSRSTREYPNDTLSGVMHVAAAIKDGDKIIGVVTLAKPSRTLLPLISRGEQAVFRQGLWLLGITILIGAVFTLWLSISLRRLVSYAKALAKGESAKPPSISNNEIGQLARALKTLRNEVDGRFYVEHYVQHLTHEMKSPLAAMQGAAELLAEENLPAEERARFAQNALLQTARLQNLIDKLLRLAQLEQQRELENVRTVFIADLFSDQKKAFSLRATAKNIALNLDSEEALSVSCEPFLIGLALSNLIENAFDFSPQNSRIFCRAVKEENILKITVKDEGKGVENYAKERLFERFFSCPRPDTNIKSTGLGLSLVAEIAKLHGGEITLENHPQGGAIATLKIALKNN